jgi:hypothetical protein
LNEAVKLGYLITSASVLVASYLFISGKSIPWVTLFTGLALISLVLSINKNRFLLVLYHYWMALGHLLGRIVSPIVLGLIFFVLITPVALLGRIAGRDPLRIKPRAISSYWINREPAGPAPDSFKNQF